MKTHKIIAAIATAATAIIAALTIAGCNDTPTGTDKGGAADSFLNAFNSDKGATYALAITINPPESGDVTKLPSPDDNGLYEDGTSVRLEAAPKSGTTYVFDKWTENGTDIGANSVITITMNANRAITANFKPHPIILGDRQAWVNRSNGHGFAFYANGAYQGIILENDEWRLGASGRWRIEDNTIFVDEGKNVWKILTITGTALVLEQDWAITYEVENGVNILINQ
jgi:hypothetical protein